MGQITCYVGTTSAQFQVQKICPVKGFIDEFIRKSLSEYEYDKQRHTYTFICDYVVRDENTGNVVIPINFLPKLEEYLTTYGYPNAFKRVPLAPIEPRQSTIAPNPKWKPREHQIPIIDYILHDSRSRKGISLQTGGGKGTTLDTLVRTPLSWTPMRDIVKGNQVIAPDGLPYIVTGTYPQPKQQVYRVRFRDNRYVDVDGSHLWKVLKFHSCTGKLISAVHSTEELYQLVPKDSRLSKLYVPLISPEQTPEINLPIDPYVLGTLIANGSFSAGPTPSISTPDSEVIDYVRERLPEGCVITKAAAPYVYYVSSPNVRVNLLYERLKDLGLAGHRAESKFIPEIYMNASIEQRWDLLQGLMDGDGTVGKKKPYRKPSGTVTCGTGALSYSTSSERLALQIQQLIWSMGDMCKCSPRWTHFTYKGERRKAHFPDYRLHIRAKKPSMYFKCNRKKSLVDDNNQYAKQLKLRIDSIEPVYQAETKCITVDSPENTYVAKDYIVTHNTFIANNSAAQLGLVTMVIMGSNIPQWVKNISEQTTVHENFTYVDSKDYNNIYKWVKDCNAQAKERGSKIWILMGSDSFYQLANDKVYPDIFVCSIATLREFIDCGESYKNLPWTWQGFLKEYGVGTKIVDEAHQNFHAVNKLDLLSNIKNNLYLTATFLKSGVSASRIFNTVYPTEMQYGDSDIERYTNVTVYAYRGMVPSRFVKRKRGYNAIKYEQYLLKRPMWMKDYLENIVLTEVYVHFVRKRNEGEKCLLFFSTKAMIERVRDFLNVELAKYGLVAKEKIGGTPDDVLNDPNYHIYIGTPSGMGTGRDIPHLRTAINFVSFDSKVLTKQCYGRLRRIPGVDTEWVDNVDRMIDSQVRHWQSRDKFYRKAAKNYVKLKLS